MGGRTLPQVIGARVRELREAAERSQQDVAAAANAMGWPWGVSSVASLELGRRQLSAAELVLLPAVLAAALELPITMENLLAGIHEDIWLAPEIVAESGEVVLAMMWTPKPGGAVSTHPLAQRMQQLQDAAVTAMGPLERWLAEALQIPEEEVARRCTALWGRPFRQERDSRVAERAEDRRSLQAIKGHVSRALIAELRADLASRPYKEAGRRGAR